MRKDFDKIQPTDPDKYWPDAEKMLDQHFQQKRRNRRIAFVFVVVLGLLGTSYFLNSYMDQSAQSPYVNSNSTNLSKTSPGNEVKNVVSENSNRLKQTDLKNKKVITNISNDKQNPEQNSSTGYDVAMIKTKIKDTVAIPKTKMKVQRELNIETTLNQQEENRKNDENNLNILAQIQKSDPKPKQDTEEESAMLFKNINTENVVELTKDRAELSLLNPIKGIGLSMYVPDHKMLTKESIQLPEELASNTKSGLAISFYIGIHSVSKTLKAEESTHFLERRKQEEKNILAPALGVNLAWIRNNFSTSFGLEYSYLGEKSIYGAYSQQTKYTQVGNWQTYNRMVTDTDTAYASGLRWFLQTQVNQLDSTYYSYTDTSSVKVFDPSVSEHNGVTKFYYVEIPFMIRYQLPYKRFALGISAGISPAWLTFEKGHYLKEDQSGVESVADSKPLKTFILNGRIGLDLSYSLNPRLNLFVSPGIKTNLKSISNVDQAVLQKYTSTGISLGFVYKIK